MLTSRSFVATSNQILWNGDKSLRRRWTLASLVGKPLNVARILKAALTFDGAARYAAYKVERHTGIEIAVTPFRERHPFLAAPGAWLELQKRRREMARAGVLKNK